MDRSNGFEKLTAQFSTRTSHFHDTPHVPSKRLASGEGDSLVKDAGELEADNHVADDHEIRIDRAGPICAQGRLEHDVGTCSVRFSPSCTTAAVTTWTASIGARP